MTTPNPIKSIRRNQTGGKMLLTLSIALWAITTQIMGKAHDAVEKLRRRQEGLTTTEWALLVAGAAAIAIAVVAVVRTNTNSATDSIKTDVNTVQTF